MLQAKFVSRAQLRLFLFPEEQRFAGNGEKLSQPELFIQGSASMLENEECPALTSDRSTFRIRADLVIVAVFALVAASLLVVVANRLEMPGDPGYLTTAYALYR